MLSNTSGGGSANPSSNSSTGSLAKFRIYNKDKGYNIDLYFNPDTYVLGYQNDWKTVLSLGSNFSSLSFSGSQPARLRIGQLILFHEGESVQPTIDKLHELLLTSKGFINPVTSQGRPPKCQIRWGQATLPDLFVVSLTITATLFRPNGEPIRADASIEFIEAISDENSRAQNPTSHVPEPGTKHRVVQPYDTLALIAAEEYGSPTQWRRIADANILEDPFDLKPGLVLTIPPR